MSFLASSIRTFSLPLDRRIVVPALALVGVLVAFVLGVAVGPVYIGPRTVVEALLGHDVGTAGVIVNELRLPRVLVGAMVGASLAISGAILQGVTRNPLGDPQVFGISAGAGAVAVSIIVFAPSAPRELVQPCAFVGGIAAGGFAYLMAWRGGVSPVRLALAGVAVTSILTAVTSGVLITSAFSAQVGLRWLIGGLSGQEDKSVYLVAPYFVVGTFLAVLLSRQLNVIALGDEIATSLGQHVERTRFFLLVIAALLASAAVSVAGIIGFVGLIVPHFVRLLIGNDYRLLIPTSALCGALLLMLSDTAARTMFQPHEIPVGVLTAVMGGPVFIALVRSRA